ncbi:hypothetical protein [Flammeovirga sp. SubArs3]|uniref:hypothetical protein n=1 Tax=Flammeovirga sp. SubArs3 TaxID=2995316 RepID=UPI00248B295B|nr:hypothetical protein [Flammeovirga sp. SubArs3]
MYKIQRIDQDHAILVTEDESIPLLNHAGDPILSTPEEVTKMLMDDFNESDMYDEEGHFIPQRSYIYCNLSSLTALKLEDEDELEYDISEVIQWDRAFRLNASNTEEAKAITELKAYLGDAYINLPLAEDQDMENLAEGDKIPQATIEQVESLMKPFKLKEIMALDMLNEHFQFTSVSLVIMWIAQKIETEKFVHSMLLLSGHYDAENGMEVFKSLDWVEVLISKMNRFNEYLQSKDI